MGSRESLHEELGEVRTVFDRAPGEPLTTAEVADALPVTRRTAYNRLERLAEQGGVETKKVGAKGRVWWVPGDRTTDGGARSERAGGVERSERPADGSGPYRPSDEPDRRSRRERAQFESLVDAVEEYAIFLLDADGRVESWNEGARRIKGYEASEVVGEHVSTFYTDEDVADGVPERNLDRAVAEGGLETEGWRVREDGTRFWASVVITPLYDDGDLRGYAKVTRDMTDQREYERRLEAERDLLERVLETSPIGIAVFDRDGAPTRANAQMGDLIGIDREEVGQYGGCDRELRDERGEVVTFSERPATRAIETGEPVTDRAFEIEDGEGGWRWISVNATPLRDEGGDEGRVVVTAMDITRLKEQAERLEHQRDDLEAELDEVFDRVTDGIFALDEEWRFTHVNDRAAEVLDRAESDLVGRSIWEEFAPAAGTVFEERYEHAMATQESVSFESYYEPLDVWFEVNAYPSETGLSVHFRDVSGRKERERELEHQREQFAALNNLYGVVQEINRALTRQSTREEIERLVCERLADSDSYRFAWVGEVDRASEEVVLRTEAGVEGYLDGISIPVVDDGPERDGPTNRAIREREMQVTREATEDFPLAAWREHAREYDFRSSAAIPITHENTLYGALNVYSARPDAFGGAEGEVVGQLGEVVGHAIAAVERKQALMSDEVVEVEFDIRRVFEALDLPARWDGTIAFDRTVSVGDGVFLEYGTTTGDGMDVLRAIVEQVPHWEAVRVVDESEAATRFQVRLTEPPAISVVAANAGRVVEAGIEDGDYHMTVQLPTSVDVRRVIDAIQDTYPAAEAVSRRQVTRQDRTPQSLGSVLAEELTDRQRSALEAAYFAGYFEWPRDTTNEELAASMGVSGPTFSHHLRRAENRLFGALFDAPSVRT